MTLPTIAELVLAYEMKVDKCSWQNIAEGLGYPAQVLRSAVHHLIHKGIKNGRDGRVRRRQGRTVTYSVDLLQAATRARRAGASWASISRAVMDGTERDANRIRRACERAKHYLNEESTMFKDQPGIGSFEALELRAAAHAARVGPAIQSKLLDLHTISAALFHGIQYDQVTPEQRRAAKTKNFMHMYTPGSVWKVPDEATLMAVFSQQNQTQLCFDFRLGRPSKLYETMKAYLESPR